MNISFYRYGLPGYQLLTVYRYGLPGYQLLTVGFILSVCGIPDVQFN